MREYGRTTNQFKDNLDNAKLNEIVFDQNNGDILIKKDPQEESISIYDEFVKRSIEMEIIGNKPVIYGIAIDLTESDPEAAVRYCTPDCEEFIPYSEDPEDETSWTVDRIHLTFGFWPCAFDGDNFILLNPEDYTKTKSDDEDVTDEMGNICIRLRRTYYKYVLTGDTLYFYLSNYKPDASYITAFKGTHMYISAYNVSEEDGELVSLNGRTPIEGKMSEYKSELPEGYTILDAKVYFYLVGITWLMNKKLDTTNLYLLKDIWNNFSGIDSILSKDGDLYNIFEEKLVDGVFKYGYVSQLGAITKNLLYPTQYDGSSTSYFCSLIHISNNISGFNEIKVKDMPIEFYVDETLQPTCKFRMVYNNKNEEEDI